VHARVPAEAGYLLEPESESPFAGADRVRPAEEPTAGPVFAERKSKGSVSDGLLPPQAEVETGWFSSFSYPLRGAESLGVLGVLSVVFWIFGVLVPEYCLTLMGDADSMGAPPWASSSR
jgi:hypothetical protein